MDIARWRLRLSVLGGCGLGLIATGCGGTRSSNLYSAQQVETAFQQVGIRIRVTPVPPGYRPEEGPESHATILTGGINGNPNADVIVLLFDLGAGNAANSLYAQDVEKNKIFLRGRTGVTVYGPCGERGGHRRQPRPARQAHARCGREVPSAS
jgi:hypothetical protein